MFKILPNKEISCYRLFNFSLKFGSWKFTRFFKSYVTCNEFLNVCVSPTEIVDKGQSQSWSREAANGQDELSSLCQIQKQTTFLLWRTLRICSWMVSCLILWWLSKKWSLRLWNLEKLDRFTKKRIFFDPAFFFIPIFKIRK